MSPRKPARARRARARDDARTLNIGLRSLTWAERLSIIDALSEVLDEVYAHLPLKRALYGFDIVRALELLRQQVPIMTDLQFHRELTSLVNRLRDAHTQYRGPFAKREPVASLPFLVEAYGPTSRPTYVVSKVDRRSIRDRRFTAGVTIEYWNGVPFDRAVDMHADSETGGRPDARRARALESLTFRALDYAPPPDESWVVLGYRDLDGKARQLRLYWEGIDPGRAPAASHTTATRIRSGINPAAEAVRRAKKYRFSHQLWRAERTDAGARDGRRPRGSRASRFADFITARTVNTSRGRFGYLRIWSFDVDDDDAFLEAAIALLGKCPDRGLIIDLRDNPGGFIWAAERLLQLFTVNTVAPTKFALRATKRTLAMANAPFNQAELAPWAESLARAALTGEPYSSHLPITPPERCNDIGQRYGGPVVVVVDATTYSSGALFTAGLVDNRIAPVVCVGTATGAGGANVWGSEDLKSALAAAKSPLPRLPDGVEFTLALRRAVRSNDADGTLIEDAGIAGQPYEMTRDDIFHGNRDLIEHCAEILSSLPRTSMRVTRRGRAVSVESTGLDELDVYVDGHPAGAPLALHDGRTRNVRLPSDAREVELVGATNGAVRQRRRLRLNEGS